MRVRKDEGVPALLVTLSFNAMTLEVMDYQYVRVRNVASVPAVSRFVDNRLNGYAGTPTVQRPPPFSAFVDPITLVVVHVIFVADGATDLHRSRSYLIQFTPCFTIRHCAR